MKYVFLAILSVLLYQSYPVLSKAVSIGSVTERIREGINK